MPSSRSWWRRVPSQETAPGPSGRPGSTAPRRRGRGDHLRVIAEHVTVGIADLDRDGRIVWANARVPALLGVQRDVTHTSWSDHVHPGDRDAVRAAHRDAIAGGRPFRVRHRLTVAGDDRWIEQAGTPIVGENGAVRGMVAVVTDVSAMVEFEAQARAARDRAVEASRLKSEFLATMSHEIRTPLNGVIGMADVLYRTDLSPAQRTKVSTLRTAATQLQDLLNDILDLSKIEAGRLAIERVDFDLAATIAGIVQLHASEAFDKGLHVHVELDDLPALVNGSQLRLRQVLNNLVGNAVKFTAQGDVRLTARIVRADGDVIHVRFEVSDTGIGIPGGALEAIFDPFTQGDASDTRGHGGTGLGLSISRQLVDLMGGDLTVDSVVGEGSTFGFVLAFPVVAAAAPATSGTSATGASATRGTRRARAPAPDVARRAPTASPPPPDRRSGDRDAGSRAGSLLVVEDNPINREVARELLASLGYEVALANDGGEAVDAVGTATHDAILMDCQMPGMDGYEATARIRRYESRKGRRTPIIAMTASAMVGDRQRCLDAGMDDYIAKPVSVATLTETLDRWIDDGSGGRGRSGGGASLAAEPAQDLPVIDWQILHQLSVVPGLLERSRVRFLEYGRHELAQIRRFAADGDAAALAALAHKLKGASLTIGAARLGAQLQRLEHAAGVAPQVVESVLVQLDRGFEDVREALLTTERVEPGRRDVRSRTSEGRRRRG